MDSPGIRHCLVLLLILLAGCAPDERVSVGKELLKQPGVFADYKTATDSIKTEGYQDRELIEVVTKKFQSLFDSAKQGTPLGTAQSRSQTVLPVALVLLDDPKRETIKVLDFGGMLGNHYLIARQYLGPDTKLLWVVVETEKMAASGKRHYQDENLRFVSSLDEAKTLLGVPDLVFASGSIQFTENPYVTLRQLMGLRAKYLALTRTDLLDGESDMVAVQVSRLADNGPGPLPEGYTDRLVAYPVTSASKSRIEKMLGSQYEIIARFEEGRRWIREDIQDGQFTYIGRLKQ